MTYKGYHLELMFITSYIMTQWLMMTDFLIAITFRQDMLTPKQVLTYPIVTFPNTLLTLLCNFIYDKIDAV